MKIFFPLFLKVVLCLRKNREVALSDKYSVSFPPANCACVLFSRLFCYMLLGKK